MAQHVGLGVPMDGELAVAHFPHGTAIAVLAPPKMRACLFRLCGILFVGWATCPGLQFELGFVVLA